MSQIERSFRSPLTLLEQWRDRIDGARLREVVITGYTIDLGFLEKFAIPMARALGARITLLGDPGQAVHDPVDVRQAGVAYQHGHAVCPRAFHPKLVVLLGDDDVWLAIGSGNPTLSGWGYNHELWVIGRGNRQQGPQLISDVADWLDDLPNVILVASWIADTLRQVAQRMRPATLDGRWSGVRAYGNLRQPLLDRLPTEPVEELAICAPFYDPPASAVTALIRRYKPRSVRIAVQPTVGIFDGKALTRAGEEVENQEFILLPDEPVRHGKLIEWRTTNGSVVGLTGSANATASAILLSTTQGGNCELAVLAPQAESLFPSGIRQPASAIRNLASTRATSVAAGPLTPVLLGCALVDGTLLVELAAPAETPVLVETSTSAAPGTWRQVGTVPVGQPKGRFLVHELSGGAVRAVVDQDGVRRESAVVFVTDPSRCRPRRDVTDEARLTRSYDPKQIFTDPVIGQRFTADLDRLMEQVRVTGPIAAAAKRTTVKERIGPRDRWADFLEDCDRLLGPSLSRLVYPRSEETEARTGITWSIDDADQGEIAEDEDEAVLDDVAEAETTTAAASVPAVPPDERPRYRRFAARWVAAVTGPSDTDIQAITAPVPLRMTVATLYLTLLAAGVWQEAEDWREDLRRLVSSLVPTDEALDELPPEAFQQLFAVLAVAMATLLHDAQLHGGRAADLVATAAWRDAAEWVAEADADGAEDLLLPASQPYARVITSTDLRNTITLAQESRRDPYAESRKTLAEAGLRVERRNGVWHVEGESAKPYRAATVAATELCRVAGKVVVTARAAERTVLVAVMGQTMAVADSRMVVWRLYQLSSTRTPASLVAGSPGPPLGGRTCPLAPIAPEIQNLSDSLDIDLSRLAQEIRAR